MAQRPPIERIPAIALPLQAIQSNSLEDTVQRLWEAIAGAWFPVLDGYNCRSKAATLTNNNMPDIVVIQICVPAHGPANRYFERCILQIECKRPSLDTPTQWDNTIKGQFLDDLVATSNASNRLYGAVAIGKKVQFFRFDGTQMQSLTPLSPEPFDLTTTPGLRQLERMMDYVKSTGWQWAGA
ncbi:hypothetical protein N8T08_010681 [Aspergillus melleus]|uniref:Uncharacterized protein n=1 Tax=Aspergillus melleus TaxID=138277 RepID=A0ACC3BBX1_9EURO|nr:hypothetical protein N8T08_010681 [Aspergillus melleus]